MGFDVYRGFWYLLPVLISILFLGCKSAGERLFDYGTINAINPDSTVNMIVEIPAGTTAKYELNKVSYDLKIDSIDGLPRFIDYLGYPGNYGMIPNTILPKSQGGDGDPLDIILLGPAVARGSVQKVSIIGVLELLDNGEQDDKLIAIDPKLNWSRISDIEDLDKFYPGAKSIIATFFQNYKGVGQMQFIGWSSKSKAMTILNASMFGEK